jgi:hypothetical protein
MRLLTPQAGALLFNFLSAIGIILVNKAVFSEVAFNWPGGV